MTAKAAYAARKRYRLEDIAVRGSGHTPSQRHPEYWDGDVPWLSLADSALLDKGWITSNSRNITQAGIANSSAVIHPRNTVVLLRDAGVGKSGILGKDMAVSQHFMAWQADEEILHHRYLYQWLQWMAPEFERMAVGSTVKTIGLPYFKKLAIDLPSLTAQIKVADALQSADMAIEHAESLATNLDDRHHGLMRQLLSGLQRLKGFRKTWPKYRLRDLFTEVTRQPSASVPVLSISAGRGFLSQKERFNREVSAATLANYTLLERGEFAYNKGNSKTYTCGCIYALNEYEAAAIPSVYISFRPTTPINTRFFEFFFEADMLKAQLARIINSGVRNDGLLNLATKDFFNMRIQVPDLNEQAAIAEVLNEAAETVRLQRRQLEAFQQQKRALLQRLLSGEPA